MHRACYHIVALVLLAAAPAFAQTSGAMRDVEATASLPLSAEKQLAVKTSIARYSRGLRPGEDLPRTGETLAVGSTVPPSINLLRLPEDAMTETPAITSYRFLLMDKRIAVVEPESRKVIQIIE
jgi:hypothetical protein